MEKSSTSFFGLVTPRKQQGFNTIDNGLLWAVPTCFFFTWSDVDSALSPGSTGGGIKKRQLLAVAYFLNTWSVGNRKSKRVEVFGREISSWNLRFKIFCSFVTFISGDRLGVFFKLWFSNPELGAMMSLLKCLALSTVWPKSGITAKLSTASKIVIMLVTVFLGKIGTITIFGCYFRKNRKSSGIDNPEDQ